MSVYEMLVKGCSDIANTIRAKTGKTEKICPLDFNSEIQKIVTATDLLDKSITEFDFQDMTTIPDYAFYKCANLNNVNCPNITSVGQSAFYYCTGLSNIELPDTVEAIGASAFQGSSLTEVILPLNLTKLNGSVFNYCKNLKNITFNDKIESIGNSAFRDCWRLEQDIILPESCKTISQQAFQESEVSYLSGYFTSIAGSAFARSKFDGKGLKTLVLKGNAMCTLSAISAFANTPIASGDGYIYVLDGLVENYKNATNWSVYAGKIKPLSELEDVE